MKLESRLVLVSVKELLQYLSTDRYMGKREAEAYTSLNEKTLLSAPDLPRHQPNGKILWRKSEIDAWMKRHAVNDSDSIDFDARLDELKKEFNKR